MSDLEDLRAEAEALRARVAALEAELSARPRFDRSPMLALVNAMPMLVGALSPEGRSDFLSPAFRPWLVDPDGPTIGVAVEEALIPTLRPVVQRLAAMALRGETEREEVSLVDREGVLRDLHLIVAPRRVGDDAITGVVLVGQDMTRHREADEALKASERRFSLAAEAAGLGVWDWDLATDAFVYSDQARAICGLPPDQPIDYALVASITHPDDFPRTSAMAQRALDPALKEKAPYEYRIVRPDGAVRWVVAHGEAIFETRGGVEVPVRYVGTLQDVTERVAAAHRQQLLMNELNHRVKNTLASVQSIAHLTLRGEADIEVARERITDRLVALAGAHDILTRENWEAADLHEIVAAALSPYDVPPHRLQIDGPASRISPKVAVAMALALHELVTNALKYGALSSDEGVVRIAWRIEPRESVPTLLFDWREHGGPPVASPTRLGFGARLLQQGLGTEFGGEARLTFEPEGVGCRIQAPLVSPPLLELG